MKTIYNTTKIVLLALLIAGCRPSTITEQNTNKFNYVVAQAGDKFILTMPELFEHLRLSLLVPNGGVVDTNVIRRFADSLICDTLMGFLANDVNLGDYYDQYRIYRMRYHDRLFQQFTKTVVQDKIVVDSSEVTDFYNSRFDIFGEPEQVNLYHILLSYHGLRGGPDSALFKDLPSEEFRAAAQDYARKVREMIDSPETFMEAARHYSHDTTTGNQGGLVGWTAAGVYYPPFDSIAFSMQPGDISEPYLDPTGWHIIYIDDRHPARIPPLTPELYMTALKTLQTAKGNEIGRATADSLFANEPVMVFNEPLLESDLFTVDLWEWIATVNGKDTIDCAEARNAEFSLRHKLGITNTSPDQKKKILTEVARKYIVLQAARDMGIDTLPDVAEARNSLYHKYCKNIIMSQTQELEWSPTDSMVEKYYNDHVDDYTFAKPLVVQHIIVQDSLRGEFIRDQALSGVDFMELALEYYPGEESIREELANLGEVGKGDVPDSFYQAAMRLPIGEVSHPVKTEFGYHVIKVVNKRFSLGVDDARSKILPILKQQHEDGLFARNRDDLYSRFSVALPGKLYPVHLKPIKIRRKT